MGGAFYLLPFLIQILLCNSLSVPKCKLTDSKCLTSSAKAFYPTLVPGLKEINSEPIDPMHVKEIKVNLSGLNFVMRDVTITGMKDAKIHHLSVDPEKKVMKVTFKSDPFLKGKYTASGQLLILPISGDGDATIEIKNLVIDLLIQYELTKNSAGKEVMNLKTFTYNYDIKDGNKIRLTNLFNGNEPLSTALHKFMDDNWKQLTDEFGKPILDTTNKVLFKVVRKYLKSQPIAEIAEQ